MTSNVREGDFESILDDDTLEDASQNLDDVISDSDSLTQAGQQGVEGEEGEETAEQSRIKVLIDKGKEQGFLTYDQLLEVLPDNIIQSDEFESVVHMFCEMNINVYEHATENNSLTEMTSEEPNPDSATIGTAESMVGRTIDPVRMYMREMGTVPLLTREGEIVIAKRIEEGIRESMAIMARYPDIAAGVVRTYDTIVEEEGDLGVLITGFLDPEDSIPDMSKVAEAKSSGNYQADENEEKKGLDEELVHSRFRAIKSAQKKLAKLLETQSRSDSKTVKALDDLGEAFCSLKLVPTRMEPLLDRVRDDMTTIRKQEKAIRELCVRKSGMPKDKFLEIYLNTQTNVEWLDEKISADEPWSENLARNRVALRHALKTVSRISQRTGMDVVEIKEINRRLFVAVGKTRAAKKDMIDANLRLVISIAKNIPIVACIFLI